MILVVFRFLVTENSLKINVGKEGGTPRLAQAKPPNDSLVCDVDETQSHPPSPMLLLVTSDGLLLCYYMMLSLPNTPLLNIQPELLQGTERPSTYCICLPMWHVP